MAGTIPAARQHLIDAIADEARRHREPCCRRSALVAFINSYYRGVDEDDLREAGAETLATAGDQSPRARHAAAARPADRARLEPRCRARRLATPRTVVEVVTDDMPFLVDSLTMVLNGSGLVDPPDGAPRAARAARRARAPERSSAKTAIKADRRSPGSTSKSIGSPSQRRLEDVRARILAVLDDVRVAVADWPQMRARATELATDLSDGMPGVPRADASEASAFLEWLADNHFTFLGYREYRLERGRGPRPPGRAAGHRARPAAHRRQAPATAADDAHRRDPPARARTAILRRHQGELGVDGASRDLPRLRRRQDLRCPRPRHRRAALHRPVHLVDLQRQPAARSRCCGTRSQRVVDLIGVSPVSHDGKALLHVLETYPRDELFQSSVAELVRIVARHRQPVRAPARARVPAPRPVPALLLVPASTCRATATTRRCAGASKRILREELHGIALESQVQISESTLARLHTLVRTEPEREVTRRRRADRDAASPRRVRTWSDRLRDELLAKLRADAGARSSRAIRRTRSRPPTRRTSAPADAIVDIGELRALPAQAPALGLQLRSATRRGDALHLRLFRRGDPLAMSRPAADARELRPAGAERAAVSHRQRRGRRIWIQDLEVTHARRAARSTPGRSGARFEQAFFAVWNGSAESDGFNRLVLAAGLDWRQAMVLRAVCRYLLQTGLPFSQRYMESVLAREPAIAQRLRRLFEARFDPALAAAARDTRSPRARPRDRRRARHGDQPRRRPHPARVPLGDRGDAAHQSLPARRRPARTRRYLSFKLDPRSMPGAAEAAADVRDLRLFAARRGRAPAHGHGRARRPALVRPARGLPHRSARPDEGAERQEHGDRAGRRQGRLRAEAPAGARGREEVQREGIECYRMFIRGLLDITDNIVDGKVVPPAAGRAPRRRRSVPGRRRRQGHRDVLRHRERARRRVRLLARRRVRLRRLGRLRPQEDGHHRARRLGMRQAPLPRARHRHAVAGLHRHRHRRHGRRRVRQRHAAVAHIRLLAAFNHQHIFLDPEPDPARAFASASGCSTCRARPGRTTTGSAISKGGGVYPRNAKQIALSPQARALLGIDAAPQRRPR